MSKSISAKRNRNSRAPASEASATGADASGPPIPGRIRDASPISTPFAPPVYEPSGDPPSARTLAAGCAAFLAAAALTRLPGLASKGLWFDEVRTITDSMFPSPLNHAHQLFFRITTVVLGWIDDPTLGVRIYPAACGILFVPLMFLAAARWRGAAAGWIAAALALASPHQIFYSQEGRYYAPMGLFALGAMASVVEFAREPRLRRWLWALPALFCHFMAARNHPAAQPFIMAHAGFTALAIAVTAWGTGALAQLLPRLRGRGTLGWTGAAAALAAAAGAVMILPRTRALVVRSLFHSDWGATDNVDFTWKFFSDHFAAFGLDARGVPGVAPATGALNAALFAAGAALAIRRRDSFGLAFAALVPATFAAVFAYKHDKAYLLKYTGFLQPAILLTMTGALAEAAEAAARRLRGRWGRPEVPAAAFSILAILLSAPEIARYYSSSKMPLKEQFEWLAKNEPREAKIFIYGHAAYPGALYRGSLETRHKLHYFPWRQDSGRAEMEVLQGAAEAGAAYFAYCWPWDLPKPLREWLETETEEAVRFRSVEGPLRDGVLYRIPPPPPERRNGEIRPAAAIDSIDSMGPPFVVQDSAGRWDWLRFWSQTGAGYRRGFRKGEPVAVELAVRAEENGRYYLSIRAGEADSAILGGTLRKGEEALWRAVLHPSADASELTVRLVSDSPRPEDAPPPGLTLKSLVFRAPAAHGAPEPGRVPIAGLKPLGRLPVQPGGFPEGYAPEPSGGLRIVAGSPAEFLRLKADGALPASFLPPPSRVSAGDWVHARIRLRLREAYGLGATGMIRFFDARGRMIHNAALSTQSAWCRVDWEPWTGPLEREVWREFETFVPAPPGAAAFAVYPLVWTSPGQRRYPEPDNEVELAPAEAAVVSGYFPR